MSDCVETTDGRTAAGYGRARHNGPKWLSHRWAWAQANGSIPDGMDVLHRCDNPPCINLDHLFLGTNVDNVADRHAKGRDGHPAGVLNGAYTHPEALPRGAAHGRHTKPELSARGSRQGLAKLTEADIPVIRARRAQGETLQAIAETYGTALQSVWAIVKGKTWKHVA